jgi:hypothetical protein
MTKHEGPTAQQKPVGVVSDEALVLSRRAVEADLEQRVGNGPYEPAEAAQLLGLRLVDLALLTGAGRIGCVSMNGARRYRPGDLSRYAASPGKADDLPQPSRAAQEMHLAELAGWLTANHSPGGGRLATLAWVVQVRVDLRSRRAGLLGLLVWGSDEEQYQASAALRALDVEAHRTYADDGWELRLLPHSEPFTHLG